MLIDLILYIRRRRMMAKIYFNRLLVGTITFDAIPTKYQAQVEAYGRDYVASGKMSIEEFEMLYKIPFESEEE